MDWNFHTTGETRVAVFLTQLPEQGTDVWVAVWREGEAGPITPLRIASGNVGTVRRGIGRAVRSVIQPTATSLDVYVATRVELFEPISEERGEDQIYLSGFRLCL